MGELFLDINKFFGEIDDHFIEFDLASLDLLCNCFLKLCSFNRSVQDLIIFSRLALCHNELDKLLFCVIAALTKHL